MGTPEVSGKVFRFLSAMHPALSKAERKRYAGYDPDKWYPWTGEAAAEFTELMRRSPRDTSFARGFAYVAQRAIPEGYYVPTGDLLDNLYRLPSAFRADDGTGYTVRIEKPGSAVVTYSGMPGFTNVCIAIQGELMQRMQASGAGSVAVKHLPACRLNGDDVCEFELEWSGESKPSDARAVKLKDIVLDVGAPQPRPAAPATEPEPKPAPARAARGSAQASTAAASTASAATESAEHVVVGNGGSHAHADSPPPSPAMFDEDASSDDLFLQLRKRLADADRQAKLYAETRREAEQLRVEVGRVKAQAEAEISKAKNEVERAAARADQLEKEKHEAVEALAELRRRVRAAIGND